MYQKKLFAVLLVATLHSVQSLDTEVVVLRAVRGREARLPCGQGRVFLDGPNAYVLWLKNDRDLLYRYPNEETERKPDQFNGVCDGDTCVDETALVLRRVSEQDGGMYRCRVHYQASPSVDYVIEVRLVDSPGVPRIFGEDGEEVKKGFVGPFPLGADLTLLCKVDDDQPDTLVYWRRNGEVIEQSEWPRAGQRHAEVRVRNMTRAELDAHYECVAHNADVTTPLAASVVVKMYLPALSVEIRLGGAQWEAGQPRVVDCVVVGSVPPPAIAWTLADAALRPTVHKELHDGNYTVSSLTLAPSLRDHGRRLTCRAHNPRLPNEDLEDHVALNVGFRPVCVSSRAHTIGAVVGEPETVTCAVDAAPAPLQVAWTVAGRTLFTSVQRVTGHEHRYSSTLTWVPQTEDLGALQCRATNAFGEQKRACAFAVARGGPPATPDCVALRAYPDQLRIQCKKGWDGGRPQLVHACVRERSGPVVGNVTDAAGHFSLPAPVTALVVEVAASSARGRSAPAILHVHEAKQTPLHAAAVLVQPSTSWARWAEAGAGAVVVVGACIAVAVCVRIRRARRRAAELNPDIVPRPDGSFHREPDFAREERVLGTTNITVNQLASCPNQQYSASPVPCRVVVGCPRTESCVASQHSYFV